MKSINFKEKEWDMHIPTSKGPTSLALSHGWGQVQAHSLHVLDLQPHIPKIEKVKNNVKS